MIGGDDAAAIAKVKPVLACMGTTFFEVGGLGSKAITAWAKTKS